VTHDKILGVNPLEPARVFSFEYYSGIALVLDGNNIQPLDTIYMSEPFFKKFQAIFLKIILDGRGRLGVVV
jgi:hypothetical protein